MTTASTVDFHREASRHWLAQVDAGLERGELEKRTQALWEAAAEGRGGAHDSFETLCTVLDHLVAEDGGPKELHWHFVMANAFDREKMVWKIPIHEHGIRYCRGVVTEFISTLESMD